MEKSVCILRTDNGKVKFYYAALKSVLTKVGNRPIVILSINGATRTGKSFLLSNIFACVSCGLDPDWLLETGALDTFPWKSSTKCVTKGIYISTDPLITIRDNKEIAVILMDTEGSFGKKPTNENAIIFAVSAILSSVMILNVKERIDEDRLQFFNHFCGFANAANKENDQKQVQGSTDNVFQKLIFLVRDFECVEEYQFGYYDDNKIPNGQTENYKEIELDPPPGVQFSEIRKTRESLKKCFKEIGVYLIPEPGKNLKRHSRIENMDPEFKDHLFKFIKCLVSEENLKIKEISGKQVTGVELLKRVAFLEEIFDGSTLPPVDNIFEIADKLQYRLEKSVVIDSLYQSIPPTKVLTGKEIDNLHQKTLESFKKATHLQNKGYVQMFEQELNLIIVILHIVMSYKEGIVFFKQLIDRAEALDTGCKIAKTTGTIAGVGGAALGVGAVISFALAPVTGGITAGLGVAALSAGLAGGATKITSNVTHKIMTSNLQKEIIKNQTDRMTLLQTILRGFDGNLFLETKSELMRRLFGSCDDGTGKLPDGVLLDTLSATFKTTTGAMAIVDVMVDTAGPVIAASAKELVKRAAAGVSVIFAAYEVFDLVKKWTPKHPLTPHIQQLIDKYEIEIADWQSLSRNFEK